MKPSAVSSRILLAGGGHSHVQFLKNWRLNPIAGVEVYLVSDVVNTPYSGMLPGRLAGWYNNSEMHFNLLNLCAQSGVTFIKDTVVGLSAAQHQIFLAEHPPLHFDVCSVNVGIAPTLPAGAAGNPRVVPVKPISQMLGRWHELIEDIEVSGDQPWLVTGGGAAGYEVSMALAMAACRANRGFKIQILEAGPHILPGHSAAVRKRALKILGAWGIEVRTNCTVKKVNVQIAQVSSGPDVTFERMLVTTGGEAPGWFKTTDLKLSNTGFVIIDESLQAAPGVFAAGDCAHFAAKPLNKSGVYAVRQGPTLISNIRSAIEGFPERETYAPQRRTLSLLISGDRHALGSYGPFAFEGSWVWRWKDRIDRKFMRMFGEQPSMGGAMDVNTCGGCGGKASAQAVNELVRSLLADPSSKALVPGQTEDVGYLGDMAVTVDGFRTFTQDLFLFGEVAVLHALNDLFACGVKPIGVTVMATLPPASAKIRANQLLQLMKGVMAVLAEHGIRLLNAHTAEGADVSLSITALGAATRRWPKQGLAAGQVLVLTKPLGTGALLQGWMQGRLSEDSYLALRESLVKSHGPWLAKNTVAVAAATDVSGFGLIGHLSEMMGALPGQNSESATLFNNGKQILDVHTRVSVAVSLVKAALTSLPNFSELEVNGVSAYMTAQNHAAYSNLIEGGEPEKNSSLLYDPQTNGPLLLAVAEEDADKLILELREAGFLTAKIIGRVSASQKSKITLA